MTAINYCLVKPSAESKAKILKFVDMLWNQVGEQVLKLKSDERLRPAFVFAYEDSAQVMWLSLTEQTKPLVMADIRAEAAKVANVEKLVFGALCMPSLVTELTPSAKEGMHHEKIVMHIETPHAEWLMASGAIEWHSNGAMSLSKREDRWLDENDGWDLEGQMVGFFPYSKVARASMIN